MGNTGRNLFRETKASVQLIDQAALACPSKNRSVHQKKQAKAESPLLPLKVPALARKDKRHTNSHRPGAARTEEDRAVTLSRKTSNECNSGKSVGRGKNDAANYAITRKDSQIGAIPDLSLLCSRVVGESSRALISARVDNQCYGCC